MPEKILSIDLGNKTLKACIGEENEKGSIDILLKISKNIESFNNGEIIDTDLFEEEVIKTIEDINKQISNEPKNLVLSFSSSFFNFQKIKGKISINDKNVSEDDIQKVHLIAKTSISSTNYEILFEEPFCYFVDNSYKIREPLGVEARTLEVDLIVIQCFKSIIQKIKEVFETNGFKISLILPNPIPASFIILSKKEKEQGSVLVDFGYKIFTISVFQEGKLIFLKSLNFGLSNILEDLAIDLSLDFNDLINVFENLNFEDLNLKSNKKQKYLKFNKSKINYSKFLQILNNKLTYYFKKNDLKEIFQYLKGNYKLPLGIYLIGSGTFLPYIDVFFKKQSGYAVKNNFDDILKNFNLENKDIIFFNAIGNIIYYNKKFKKVGFFESLKNIFANFFK
jgi:cell division protein FtsA